MSAQRRELTDLPVYMDLIKTMANVFSNNIEEAQTDASLALSCQISWLSFTAAAPARMAGGRYLFYSLT